MTPAPGSKTPDFDHVRRMRDKRLRRSLLSVLHGARGGERDGRVGGRTLHELAGYALPPSEQPEDEPHTLQLLRDLVRGGYATEHDVRTRKWQKFELSVLEFAITAHGAALIEEAIDPDPMIDDERIA